jgi:hypothetical protein
MGRDGFDEKPMREPAAAGSFCVDSEKSPVDEGPKASLKKGKKPYRAVDFNRNSIVFNVVSFLIPIVGMGLYVIFKEQEPVKARGILIGTLLSFGCVLLFLFWLKFRSDTMI